MKERNFTVGLLGPYANVCVKNRQDCVEYQVINGVADERSVRAAAGNYGRSMYEFSYSGYYGDRKEAITRIKNEIDKTKEYLEALEFSLKVTQKKNWVEVTRVK